MVTQQLELTIVYESSVDGWIVASIPTIAGVLSQGRTREEARANVIDALALMLSPEPGEAGDPSVREQVRVTIADHAEDGSGSRPARAVE
jgi:predicted RNase H-like HicB family nuclease